MAHGVHLRLTAPQKCSWIPTKRSGSRWSFTVAPRVEDLVDRFQAGDRFATSPATLVCQQPRLRTSSALPSGSPTEFFHRSNASTAHIVPDALRAAGATIHTMADVYGQRIGQGLTDEEWLLTRDSTVGVGWYS